MQLSLDIADLAATAAPVLLRLEEAAARLPSAEAGAAPVEGLTADLRTLLERLGSVEPDPVAVPTTPMAAQALGTLADQGLDLLSQLAHWAKGSQLTEEEALLERLSLSLACWVARHGGEIANLAPLVECAAALANRLRDPRELAGLYRAIGEIENAVAPSIGGDLAAADHRHPWRVFLLNRAIIATRTHQPRLMEEAFGVLVEHLPEDAPAFFREGMEQMNQLGYPEPVRRVMQRYYDHWCGRPLLH